MCVCVYYDIQAWVEVLLSLTNLNQFFKKDNNTWVILLSFTNLAQFFKNESNSNTWVVAALGVHRMQHIG